MVVKSIGVLSLAKLLAALNAAFGLLFGLVFALLSLIGAGFAQSGPEGLFALVFGVGGVVILPIVYGVLGFLSGALTGALYNVFAGLAGGIELELVSTGPAPSARASADPHRT